MDARLRRLPPGASRDRKLVREDFQVPEGNGGGTGSATATTVEGILSGLVGCEGVREMAKGLQNAIRLAKRRGDDPRRQVAFNYLLLGNPGTGKTTIARLMGRLFHSLGLLPFADVIEVDASKLQTGYAGQAGRLMLDTLTKAKGRVLFIDEAYALNPRWGGPYMSEVVDTLVGVRTPSADLCPRPDAYCSPSGASLNAVFCDLGE